MFSLSRSNTLQNCACSNNLQSGSYVRAWSSQINRIRHGRELKSVLYFQYLNSGLIICVNYINGRPLQFCFVFDARPYFLHATLMNLTFQSFYKSSTWHTLDDTRAIYWATAVLLPPSNRLNFHLKVQRRKSNILDCINRRRAILPAFQDYVSLSLQKIWINNIYVVGQQRQSNKKCDVVDFRVLGNWQNCELWSYGELFRSR